MGTRSPGSVSPQGLGTFGPPINDLSGLLRRHLWPHGLPGLLVVVATSGAALRGKQTAVGAEDAAASHIYATAAI